MNIDGWIQTAAVLGSNEIAKLISTFSEGIYFLKRGRTESDPGEREFTFLIKKIINLLEGSKIPKGTMFHRVPPRRPVKKQ